MKLPFVLVFLLATTLIAAQPRHDYAVFFPATTYAGGWTQLNNTLPECNALAGDLSGLYGFETEVLLNKNKQEIRAKLVELAGRTFGSDDQLLLYFSMHGYFDEAGEAGCLCPAGAKSDDPGFDTWLLHTELRTLVARIPCEHILIVLDACYSGTFGGEKSVPTPAWETPDCQANIRQALDRKTRCYIASGAKERTPAVSELAKKMRSALGGRYIGNDGILSLEELFGVLSEAKPTPRNGEFTGDLGGGFVFVPKNGCDPSDPDLKAWNYAKAQDTPEAYEFYLANFENGRYRADARRILDRLQEERVWQAVVQKGTPAAYENYKAIYCPGGLHCAEVEEKTRVKTGTPPTLGDSLLLNDEVFNIEVFWLDTFPDDSLVFVKGGTFTMGCTDEQQDCGDDEKPTHTVTIGDFYIGRYEVTQKLWTEIMGSNPSYSQNCDDCPVENVSWDDVQEFLKKLNARFLGRNYRLPTEAEWEYAARGGGKQVLFGNGKDVIDPKNINFNASIFWQRPYSVIGQFRQKPVPVGSLNSPNALGLHDMSGNVSEWCADWHGWDYYNKIPYYNPASPASGGGRVVRGGSWIDYPEGCRVASRSYGAPDSRDSYRGFRLARTR